MDGEHIGKQAKKMTKVKLPAKINSLARGVPASLAQFATPLIMPKKSLLLYCSGRELGEHLAQHLKETELEAMSFAKKLLKFSRIKIS